MFKNILEDTESTKNFRKIHQNIIKTRKDGCQIQETTRSFQKNTSECHIM